ncbi:MAG: transporter substrate-binding domain-containing protein [Segniliparus sp.]|uniref:transporter substrate-binding domain-containing protein n=1 Tax=Segniliparus sp. TaxID=2804064 RepID=UPI003F3974F9
MSAIARRSLAALAALAAVSGLAGCGEPEDVVTAKNPHASAAPVFDVSPKQPNRVRAAKVDAIAAELPQAVRDRGSITVTGSSGSLAPLRFYASDNKTFIGNEIDIATLIGDILGLKVDFVAGEWAQNFVTIDSGQADLFVSNVTVTEERKDKYDFATYRKDDVAFEVKHGSGRAFAKRQDIAGLKIGVDSATNQEQLLVEWNAKNVAEGLAPAELVYYQKAGDYYLALASGRLDAYLGPNPTVQYHAAVAGETDVAWVVSGAGDGLQGWIAALTKKGNGLAKPVADAINHAIGDGSYQRVLDTWAIGNEAVAKSEINPPGLPRKTA